MPSLAPFVNIIFSLLGLVTPSLWAMYLQTESRAKLKPLELV